MLAATASAQNIDRVIQIIGSTFDVQFAEHQLPAIYNAVKITSQQKDITLNLTGEVQQHLGSRRVRQVKQKGEAKRYRESFGTPRHHYLKKLRPLQESVVEVVGICEAIVAIDPRRHPTVPLGGPDAAGMCQPARPSALSAQCIDAYDRDATNVLLSCVPDYTGQMRPEDVVQLLSLCRMLRIPEPNILAMLAIGFVRLLAYAWRKRKQLKQSLSPSTLKISRKK